VSRPAARAGLALTLCALAAPALSACQSTQATSAQRAKHAKTLLHEKGLRIGRENAHAAVTHTTVVHDANGTAAVVEVRNRGAAQATVPIGLAVHDAGGDTVYSNDTPGLEASLVAIPVLDKGGRTFWINDQIPSLGGRPKAVAKLGVAKAGPPRQPPRIEISKVAFGSDSSGVFVEGTVTNRSKVPQKRLVIACVARRGGHIVAAGRAVIDKLAPAPTPKPTKFTVYFIGNPKGAQLSFAAPPTVLQ
jgi:hypothetical protein